MIGKHDPNNHQILEIFILCLFCSPIISFISRLKSNAIMCHFWKHRGFPTKCNVTSKLESESASHKQKLRYYAKGYIKYSKI